MEKTIKYNPLMGVAEIIKKTNQYFLVNEDLPTRCARCGENCLVSDLDALCVCLDCNIKGR